MRVVPTFDPFEHCHTGFSLSLERSSLQGGSCEATTALLDDESVIYQRHDLRGLTGPINPGHHATLASSDVEDKTPMGARANRIAASARWLALSEESRMTAGQPRWVVSFAALILIGGFLWGVEAAAQDPARWKDVVAAFAAGDVASPPPTTAIVFIGSSSIVLWKTVHEDMRPLTVINRGFGGSTMQDVAYWLDALVLKYRPRAVVVYEGDNDIGQYNVTAEEVLKGFQTLISRIHAQLPETRIYFLSIKPSILWRGAWPEMMHANDLIQDFCARRPQLLFIDVASSMLDRQGQPKADIFGADGLHMNDKGYDIWTSVVRPILLEHEAVHELGSRGLTPEK